MAPRRSHKKSRAGCLTCKKRRVKCDEVHPMCTNCLKREVSCNWEESDQLSVINPSSPPSFFTFDMGTLELLHHFSTVTSYTYNQHPERLEVFRTTLPRLSLSHDYLMHIILAHAALHMSVLHMNSGAQPSRYNAAAIFHREHAIVRFQYAQSSGTKISVSAKHMYIGLLNIFAMTTVPSFDFSIFDWLKSGRMQMLEMKVDWDELLRGEMSRLFKLELEPQLDNIPAIYANFPEYLNRLLSPYESEVPDAKEIEDERVRLTYESSIKSLRHTWAASLLPSHRINSIHIWPYCMTDEFWSLLTCRRPRALVILAHYCALMIFASPAAWWLHGRGYNDLLQVVALLDDRWLRWVEWPSSVALSISLAEM